MFQAYHGVTAAQHQSNFNTYSAQGYRMISLSVYGDPPDVRYAAVWVQRAGPAWVAAHGLTASGYQSFFNNWTAQGYAPTLVTATGPANAAVFATVFEKGVVGPWMARHGVPAGPASLPGTFGALNKTAADQRQMIRSFAIYGTPADRRYIAVWHANPTYVKWHVHAADPPASYQSSFDLETQLPGYGLRGYRPAFVSLSGDQTYCSVFKDDVVGEWVAKHGMTAAQYQAEFNARTQGGLMPICVQGGGAGANTRYAAIFAKTDLPLARGWSVTGPSDPALAGFDHIMQGFMQANGVRAAQLSIAKNGVAKHSRGYTWAEPGYRTTNPSDRFLLASCSKMFLEAAVQSLYDAGKLTPDTRVYPLLGFTGPLDARSDKITIQQLLDHQGGYNDEPPNKGGSGFDPTYRMREIALALGLNQPVRKLDVCRYMYTKYRLDFDPGTQDHYSNFGYLLAGAVVEKVSKKTYFDYVNTALLAPMGITEAKVFATRSGGRTPDEAIVEDQGFGLDPIDLASQALIPSVYGGDGEINEVGDPNAGLAASAQAMTKFIQKHAVWGNGGRMAGYARSGSTPGSSTWAKSRGDGVDWAYTINTRDWPPAGAMTLDSLNQQVDHLLDTTAL